MKLLAIDGNSILNRAFYGVRLLSNQKGMYTNAIFGFLNILLKLQKDYPTELMAITFDLSAPTFRHIQYEEYKANRKGMPEELAVQLQPLKDLLTAMGYQILEKEGFEADDILGTLAKLCTRENCDCVIATGDRDALQLIDKRVGVCLVKTKGNVYYDTAQFQKDYGFDPIHLIDLKALMGDSSDNIPGVKGIGEKTAMNLIQKYQTVDFIYQHLDELEATPRVKRLLQEGKDSATLSRALATICLEVPLEIHLKDLVPKKMQTETLSNLLIDLEMFSFFDKLHIGAIATDDTEKPKKKVSVSIQNHLPVEELKKQLEEDGIIHVLWLDQLYFVRQNQIICYQHAIEEIIKQVVFASDLPKRTYMAKSFYKLARVSDCEFKNLIFDAELAAYLLNVSSKGYLLEHLTQKYLSTEYDIEASLQPVAGFIDLCEELMQRVEQEQMLKLLQEIELPLCEVLSDMEYEGFGIDIKQLEIYREELQDQIDQIKEEILQLAGHEFNPNSTKELGTVLFEELGLPSQKKTKTGYSTNVDVLESLLGKHPIIEKLLEYRKLTKLQSTYVIGLLKVVGKDGRVHSTFNQTETRTGRISSIEPNVQNIPIRTEQGSKIRKCFVARPGYVLVDADYSQIELRILAHIAQDEGMQKAFAQGVDIHQVTASEVFKVPLEQVTPQMRSRAKAINFGIVYGIGAYSLSQDIDVSVQEAKEYIGEYLKTYSGVERYMEQVVEQAEKNGYVETLYHRRRDLLDIHSSNKTVKAFAKRIALNTPIQGTAADIIKIAMIRVYQRLKREDLDAKLILQVHDELIIEAPALQASIIANLLKEEMEHAANLLVRLLVDVHTGINWLEAKG